MALGVNVTDLSLYRLGETGWEEGRIRATWGVIGPSQDPNGFAEITHAQVLHFHRYAATPR